MKICLIGGTGRSGTTVITRMFSRHPELVDVPEWRFLIDPDGIVDFLNNSQSWSPFHYDLQVKRLYRVLLKTAHTSLAEKLIRYLDDKLFRILPSSFKWSSSYSGTAVCDNSPNFLLYVEQLITQLNQFQYKAQWVGLERGSSQNMYYAPPWNRNLLINILREFLVNIMQDVTGKQNKSHYLEKNTWNILCFDNILEILPEAKMLHIYRDPRDVVASFVKQTWMPSSVEQSAIIYRDLYFKWQNVKSTISNNTFYECSLESLVDDTEDITRKICTFWGLQYYPELIDFDLSKSHHGRWRKDFSKQEITHVETILADPLNQLGYH